MIENSLTIITTFATAVIAVSAFVTAWLTSQLAKENRRLRRAGTEPNVIAYIALDKRHRECLNMVIANVGNGPAYDVRISREADEQNFADYALSFTDDTQRPPIPLISSGDRLETFLNTGSELFADDWTAKLKPFEIFIQYEDSNERTHKTKQTLDVAAFKGLVTVGKPAEHEIAESLKEISKIFGVFFNQQKRLKVETITTEEVEEKRKVIEKSKRNNT